MHDFFKPTNLSISKIIQTYLIEFENKSHPFSVKWGCRVVTIIFKTATLIVDIALNILVGLAKIFIGLLLLPLHFTASLHGKAIPCLQEGFQHLVCVAIYSLDFFAQPLLNIYSPDLYLRRHRKYDYALVDINTQSKNGYNLLTEAVYCKKAKQVERLIKAGANLHAVDIHGSTPYFRLKYVNQDWLSPSLQNLIAQEKGITEEKTFKTLKMLGHVSSLSGTFALREKTVNFEGINQTPFMVSQMQKSIDEFAHENQALMPKEVSMTIKNTLKNCQQNMNGSSLSEQYRAGQPLLIDTGYFSHCLYVVIWDGFFIICNNNGDLGHLTSTYTLKSNVNIEALINKLQSLRTQPMQDSEKFYAKLLQNDVIHPTQLLPLKFTFAKQKVGNCAYFNLELAAYTLWQMASLKQAYQLSSLSEIKNIDPTELNKEFRKIFCYDQLFQMFQIQKYINKAKKRQILPALTTFDDRRLKQTINQSLDKLTTYLQDNSSILENQRRIYNQMKTALSDLDFARQHHLTAA